jgi:nitrate/nitrite transport system permease protein
MRGFSSWRAPALSLLIFLLFVAVWHAATLPTAGERTVDAEYAKLVGAEDGVSSAGGCGRQNLGARERAVL